MPTVENRILVEDTLLVKEAENAFRSAFKKYRRTPLNEQYLLSDEISKLSVEWVKSQNNLLDPDKASSEILLKQIRSIKREIDRAAETQQLVIAVGKLIAFFVAL